MARQIQRWGYQYEGVDENGSPVGKCEAVRDKNGAWVRWSDVAPILAESRKTVQRVRSCNNARDEILPGQCPACHGCGNVMVSHVNECSVCNGTGKTPPVA